MYPVGHAAGQLDALFLVFLYFAASAEMVPKIQSCYCIFILQPT